MSFDNLEIEGSTFLPDDNPLLNLLSLGNAEPTVDTETEEAEEETPQAGVTVKEIVTPQFEIDEDTPEEEAETTPTATTPESPVETEEETPEVTEEAEEEQGAENENYFEVFGKGLSKLGILEAEEDFEWTEETFIDKFNEAKEKSAFSLLQEMAMETQGEEGLKLFEHLFINKAPLKEYLQATVAQEDLATLDLDDEDNQRMVFEMYHKELGMDDDEIADKMDFAISKGRFDAEVQKAHQKLVQRRNENRERMAAEAKVKRDEQEAKERIQTTTIAQTIAEAAKTGELSGVPISNKEAEKLFSFMTFKPHVLPNGQKITDFEYKLFQLSQNPETKAKLALLVLNDLNLKPIEKKAVSKETNFMFKEIKNKVKTSTVKTPKADDNPLLAAFLKQANKK